MTLWHHTLELVRIGFISLFKSPDGYRNAGFANVITFVALPILVIAACIYYGVIIKESLVSDILTVLSIFLAITLGVIFIVPDKLSKRLEEDNSANESDANSRIRYKNFCKLFIQRLSFVLVLCVLLIIIAIVMEILPGVASNIFSSLIIGLFALSILSILKLIIDIYVFLMSDLSKMDS